MHKYCVNLIVDASNCLCELQNLKCLIAICLNNGLLGGHLSVRAVARMLRRKILNQNFIMMQSRSNISEITSIKMGLCSTMAISRAARTAV